MKWYEKMFIVFVLAALATYALDIVYGVTARTAELSHPPTLWVPRLPPNVELGLKPDGTVVWRMVAPFPEELDKPDTPSDTPRP